MSEKWIRRAYGTTYDVCQCLGFWFFLSVAVLGQDQPTRQGEMRFNSVSGSAPIAGGPIGFVSLARDPVCALGGLSFFPRLNESLWLLWSMRGQGREVQSHS